MKKGIVGLLLFLGTASIIYLVLCSRKGSNVSVSLIPVMGSLRSRSGMALIVKSRKLKDNFDTQSTEHDGGFMSLADYRPIDPVPSSTASIQSGPIQHEAPLLPYIPQPAPPPNEHN